MRISRKPTILIVCDYFTPAYKAGGPPRSISNLIEQTSDLFSFRVVTRDRDLSDRVPFPNCKSGSWQRMHGAEVLYLPPDRVNFRTFRSILRETPYDVLYLNSFFSPRFTILPLALRRLRLVPWRPLVLAPRGELSAGALGLKRWKKWAFIQFARMTKLYGDVLWQASSEYEEASIRNVFGLAASVRIAPNLRNHLAKEDFRETVCHKAAGSLSVVFLSRISRKKNLDGALRMLARQKGQIEFHIYGPREDGDYWNHCLRLIESMPLNIRVFDHGAADPDTVLSVFQRHHVFLLPTLGENFGFVILESLAAGCPVLISDQTPWRNLESKGVGWDLPLEPSSRFDHVLQQCVEMDDDAFQRLSQAAARFGRSQILDPSVPRKNCLLFQEASNKGRDAVIPSSSSLDSSEKQSAFKLRGPHTQLGSATAHRSRGG